MPDQKITDGAQSISQMSFDQAQDTHAIGSPKLRFLIIASCILFIRKPSKPRDIDTLGLADITFPLTCNCVTSCSVSSYN